MGNKGKTWKFILIPPTKWNWGLFTFRYAAWKELIPSKTPQRSRDLRNEAFSLDAYQMSNFSCLSFLSPKLLRSRKFTA